ncbi:MAG: PhzF family phenazine biosynthesis protein [Ignavibacteriales bacterium]
MGKKEFIVVNSFAEKSFGGNPAAVFVNADGLETSIMQLIARQMNLVETAFVFPSTENDHDFRFRYFTPLKELPITGHPTIAAIIALIENKQIDVENKPVYRIKTNVGIKQINIGRNQFGPVVTMEQQKPRFLEIVNDRKNVADILGLDLGDLINELPIQAVDTGLGHIIVPVKSLDALMRVQRKIEPLKNLCASLGVMEAQVFTFETYEQDKTLHTRNICPREGIEDPGCGVGNGALGAYLIKHYYKDEAKASIRAEQGNIVNMPCVIETVASRKGDEIDVSIGGNGKVMIEGTFLLD